MDYKQRLIDYVEDLNLILKDVVSFPKRDERSFYLQIDDKKLNDFHYGIKLFVIFTDRGHKHTVYHNKANFIGDTDMNINFFYKRAYYELLKNSLFAVDCIGKIKEDETGRELNYLSFTTLFNSGLETIIK